MKHPAVRERLVPEARDRILEIDLRTQRRDNEFHAFMIRAIEDVASNGKIPMHWIGGEAKFYEDKPLAMRAEAAMVLLQLHKAREDKVGSTVLVLIAARHIRHESLRSLVHPVDITRSQIWVKERCRRGK